MSASPERRCVPALQLAVAPELTESLKRSVAVTAALQTCASPVHASSQSSMPLHGTSCILVHVRSEAAAAMQEEQFEATCALVREVGFDRVNTAAYSPRPSTPAAVWDNQIADLVKADRLHRLNRIVNEVAEERAQRFVGTLSEVRLPCCCDATH